MMPKNEFHVKAALFIKHHERHERQIADLRAKVKFKTDYERWTVEHALFNKTFDAREAETVVACRELAEIWGRPDDGEWLGAEADTKVSTVTDEITMKKVRQILRFNRKFTRP